jgi:hypothetical protein
MEYWENQRVEEWNAGSGRSLLLSSSVTHYSIIPFIQHSPLSESSQLARADLDSESLAGRGDFHFFQSPFLCQGPGGGAG